MSKFNATTVGSTKTTNLAGGNAYVQTPELELISILATSFASDTYYRSTDDTINRLKRLIGICDKKFVAQALIFARKELGMRSITHVGASELAKYISGEEWGKNFYSEVINRPDDMTEIISYHTKNNGKLSNAIKKGFKDAFNRFDKYAIAKYKAEDKEFSMIDIVRLIHPTHIEKNAEALDLLIKGELKSFDTWESELSAVGQHTTDPAEKARLKKEVWTRLITERKIGYFALLKNLRNIIQQAPEAIDLALEMLTNEYLIKKSLVLPFRFLTAFEEINKLPSDKITRTVLNALNTAVDISLSNVPKFDGDTLVVLDISASMNKPSLGNKSPHVIGALFSAVLLKASNADFMTFDGSARYVNVNHADSTMTLATNLRFSAGATNFHAIFQTANKKYDRVIILSDMQGWVGRDTPVAEFNLWKTRYNANPFVYSFDLAHYGSMQFPENMVFAVAGFSDKIFSVMSLLESDKKALINTIKSIPLQKIKVVSENIETVEE